MSFSIFLAIVLVGFPHPDMIVLNLLSPEIICFTSHIRTPKELGFLDKIGNLIIHEIINEIINKA
jgi:hypothetical protein